MQAIDTIATRTRKQAVLAALQKQKLDIEESAASIIKTIPELATQVEPASTRKISALELIRQQYEQGIESVTTLKIQAKIVMDQYDQDIKSTTDMEEKVKLYEERDFLLRELNKAEQDKAQETSGTNLGAEFDEAVQTPTRQMDSVTNQKSDKRQITLTKYTLITTDDISSREKADIAFGVYEAAVGTNYIYEATHQPLRLLLSGDIKSDWVDMWGKEFEPTIHTKAALNDYLESLQRVSLYDDNADAYINVQKLIFNVITYGLQAKTDQILEEQLKQMKSPIITQDRKEWGIWWIKYKKHCDFNNIVCREIHLLQRINIALSSITDADVRSRMINRKNCKIQGMYLSFETFWDDVREQARIVGDALLVTETSRAAAAAKKPTPTLAQTQTQKPLPSNKPAAAAADKEASGQRENNIKPFVYVGPDCATCAKKGITNDNTKTPNCRHGAKWLNCPSMTEDRKKELKLERESKTKKQSSETTLSESSTTK